MASQYDAIGSKYNIFKQLPTSTLEAENLKRALGPYLAKADRPRVLDLACGTGYYSRKLLEWGAGSVIGVDLSTEMVEVARRTATRDGGGSDGGRSEGDGRLRFMVGDALELGRIGGEEEEPFDIVVGTWLLNYAPDLAAMARMFRTVAANLRDGGVFAGVTPHPAEDLDGFARATNEFERLHPRRFGAGVVYYEKLESGEGWKTEVSAGEGEHEVSFRNYHLHKTVYQRAAELGGMNGMLRWQDIKAPPPVVDRAGEGFWKEYFDYGPHMGVVVVEK